MIMGQMGILEGNWNKFLKGFSGSTLQKSSCQL